MELFFSFSPPAAICPYFETQGREKEDYLACGTSSPGEASSLFWTLPLSVHPTCHLSIRPLPSVSYCHWLNSALISLLD